MGFTHLHVATAYSAHYGVCWPAELAQAAAADGATALACTDRDGLYGAIKHISACAEAGLDPILGVNLAVTGAGRVTVLAEGATAGAGYRLLCELVSALHGTKPAAPGAGPEISFEAFSEFLGPYIDGLYGPEATGLTVLIGPASTAGTLLAERRYQPGVHALNRWRAAIPAHRLALEVVCHLSPPGDKLSVSHAVRMLKAAKDTGLRAVLTNAVRYATPDQAATADVLDAARTLTSLSALTDLQTNAQGWLKPAVSMHQLAKEIAHHAGYGSYTARRLLEETEQLAAACALDLVADLGWGQPRIPEISLLGITEPAETAITARSWSGLATRYPEAFSGANLKATASAQHLKNRLEQELNTIRTLGFSGFFLTVAGVCDLIHEDNIRLAARGSGASSLVNYVLGISDVDPIAHNLVFERFLSNARSTLPDIDIDVESARRHEIYQKIFRHFGSERVSLMSMQNGYRVRGAVRDAGLALGLESEDIDQIAKQLWRFPASTFREALEKMPELEPFRQRMATEKANGHQQLDLLVDITERLDRLPRHISMHPCGVILSDPTLLHRTPVQPSGMGLPMSQFDKHDMDPMGLLKLDVLGVRMQSTIAYAVAEAERTEGVHIDFNQVPLDDPDTFAMIQTTHTLGCFQIESPGQRELIGKLVPQTFNDLIVDISLFRPGPMQSDMVRPFLEQRHGFAQARYPHPDLEPILAETHGVVVFHEQVLRIFATMTGCTLAAADEFRRILGSDQEPTVEEYFRAHALKRGYSLTVIDHVWQTLAAFGSFGFCKAHGAAFAVPTYHSAWLKTHYPEAFMAALFEHDPGMYPRRLLIAEAKRMGIRILPIDINASTAHFHLEELSKAPQEDGTETKTRYRWGIRMALPMLAGISDAEVARIVAAQPFDSFTDVRQRAKPSKRTLERLIQLGAFDELYRDYHPSYRHELLAMLHQASPNVAEIPGQLALPFSNTALSAQLTAAPVEADRLANLRRTNDQANRSPNRPSTHHAPAATDPNQLRTELDLLGAELSGHVLDPYRPTLAGLRVSWAEELLSLHNRTRVLVAGIRVATQTPPMRGGKRVVFLSLDDGTGCVDCAFFTEAQHASGPLLFATPMLLVEGYTRRTGPAGISIQAVRAWDLQRPELLPAPGYLDAPAPSTPVRPEHHRPVPVPHPETWELLPTPPQ
ncbi:DNA polymerase III subunit alpha [Micrococcoides hystricis]|uniref:DNA-directed DNA polymerase n=1 Tax=Micrococcoides hystricis TaxID=1572761 RepID=A0ABV6P7K3_9MICC